MIPFMTFQKRQDILMNNYWQGVELGGTAYKKVA